MQRPPKVRFPRIVIPEPVWKRLMAYIQACPMEVGGLGNVESSPDGELVVTDVFLIEQEVTSFTTELDPEGVARFIGDWVSEGRDISGLRFWWHSHAESGTIWSKRDVETMRSMAEDSWLISLVGNRRREHRTRLTIGGPVPVEIDDITIEIVEEVDAALAEAAEQEVGKKVRSRRGFLSRFGKRKSSESEDRKDLIAAIPLEDLGFMKGEMG